MHSSQRLLVAAIGLTLGLLSATATAVEYHFNPGSGSGNDFWVTTANWTPNGEPKSINDIVVFDATGGSAYSTNVHNQYYTVQEMRFATTATWNIHNARQDPKLQAPSGSALITQNGSGAVTFNSDLVFNSNTIFGGTGSGSITVNGSGDGSDAYKETVRGVGGLTKQGSYTLTLNAPVSYQGPTVINAGAIVFNGDSLTPSAPWTEGSPVAGYTPVDLAPITVNSTGTLGGSGNVRADVTVNSGGIFAPGSQGVTNTKTMTLKSLSLKPGSATSIELGGAAPGNGTGYYDQTTVTSQLSLAGALNVSLAGSPTYTLRPDTTFTLFKYGTLDAAGNSFTTVNLPAIPDPSLHAGWNWVMDYGTGTDSQVNLTLQSNPWYFTAGSYDPSYVSPNPTLEPASQPWWAIRANWSYNGKPGFDPAWPDVVIFDDAHYNSHAPAERQTNIHDAGPGWLKEIQVNTSSASGWHFYNNNRTLAMKNPTAGQPARFTQNGSGPIVMDDNLRLDSDTIFGGSGSGRVTINGCQALAVSASAVDRLGVHGNGALIHNGHYTLVINNVANYQGTTTINSGATLLFNAETAKANPAWVYGTPSTYYIPSTQGAVTVNAGGTLGGTGKLHAPVEVTSGGFLAPGASAGIFTVDSLTLDPGSTTLIELGGATAGNGNGFHDQVVVNNQLSLSGTLDVSLINGFLPNFAQSFVLFRYGSLDPTHRAFDALIAPVGPWGNFALDYGSGLNSQVTLMAVPEPATIALWGLGALMLAMVRKKRA
jgi:autotransporter-associated beta strand protein